MQVFFIFEQCSHVYIYKGTERFLSEDIKGVTSEDTQNLPPTNAVPSPSFDHIFLWNVSTQKLLFILTLDL